MEEIDQIDQNRSGPGNTETGPRKQGSQHTYWCFTLNNYTMDQIDQLVQIGQHECDWYIFQEEKGELTGTMHLQGTLKLKKKQRMTALKNWNPRISWRATKCISGSIAYCTKEKTLAGQRWHKGIEVPEIIEVEEPYGWQLQIMEIISTKPDKRTIHWFWEPEGNVGKSTFCKYLVTKHNALMISGKAENMYYMINKYPGKRKLIICDVPRVSIDYLNYAAIENIKNGLIFSGKYECCQLAFNCPHVIIFANEPPDESKMSKDRWHVVKIEN